MLILKCCLLPLLIEIVDAICPTSIRSSLPFVLEYALWRGWHQAVLYTPSVDLGCNSAIIQLTKCMSVNGIAMATRPRLVKVWIKLGVVILTPRIKDDTADSLMKTVKEITSLEMNTESYDWLMVGSGNEDMKKINNILNATALRFDQNIVVSYSKGKPHLGKMCENNFLYKPHLYNTFEGQSNNCRFGNKWNPKCVGKLNSNIYYAPSSRFRNLTKNKFLSNERILVRSGLIYENFSETFIMTNASRFALPESVSKYLALFYRNLEGYSIDVVQYFKVRPNSTLYAHFLGTWTIEKSMSTISTPYPVEARSFLGENLNVGRCNSSSDGTNDEEGPIAPELLDDVVLFLAVQLNATISTRYFSKLGFRTYEGAWTGLLGALVEGNVDVALEPVTEHSARNRDIDFVFPIAETMCNIYIRHQETSAVRDIFVAPFSARLLACVVAVAVVAAIFVVTVSKLTPGVYVQSRPMELTEALLWSTGILCQQGGNWTPPSPAASTILIVCLLFAVITYNSYAAFITSVLSVRVDSLDTVGAVLHSTNFKIGYIRNGADQMYLMSTKDAQLNEFYIRGYSDAENLVTSVEDGLERAASQDYAFFSGQRAARTKLRAFSQARGRCALRELPVPSTKTHLAFPLPYKSPYAKPTLLSLLSLRSAGALALLGAALVPSMPQCAPPPGFASARATDVISALILLAVGILAALIIGATEYSWKNRKELKRRLFHNIFKRLYNLIH